MYSHMIKNKPNGYWTKELCKQEAMKYNTIKEFYTNSKVAYTISSKNKWLDEIRSQVYKINIIS